MEEDPTVDDGDIRREGEVAPALISVHPLGKSVAVAVGSELRVFDLVGDHDVTLSDDSGGPSHSDSIRAICFDAEGCLFASAGDDKLVKLWNVDSWRCVGTVFSEKRVSAVSITPDASFVCFADKFGVVWIVSLSGESEHLSFVDKRATPLLGHYCSIITSLKFSPDGKFIASADRDFKIRVTAFPKKPLKGAHEIQSFCLGHTEFVSCLAFAHPQDHPQAFLLSGGGDSTVRLWDYISGVLLDTCVVGTKSGFMDSEISEEEGLSAVTDLCVFSNASLVAVAIQSLHGLLILHSDFSSFKLSAIRVLSTADKFIPTSLGMNNVAHNLWMVMGASSLPPAGINYPVARVKVVSGFQECGTDAISDDLVVLEDDRVPGANKLLEKLQGNANTDGESLTAAAEALKTAMHKLLIKKQYSVEKREHRKKSRNDRKLKL